MKDIFYEESAEILNKKSALTKYHIFKILSILFYILLILWGIVVLTVYPLSGVVVLDIFGIVFPILFLLASAIVFGIFKNKFYVEYDYAIISGSIRFSKITNNTKRKFIIKFNASCIEKLGRYNSETYIKYAKSPGVYKLILSSNYEAMEGKEFYYLVINYGGDKKLFVLECTEVFIVNLLKCANKSIIEEDFI